MAVAGYEVPAGLEIARNVVLLLAYLAFALYLVYDPETIGDFTGSAGRAGITSTTPAPLIRFAGCGFLALPATVLIGNGVSWPLGALVGIVAATGLYYLAQRLWPL